MSLNWLSPSLYDSPCEFVSAITYRLSSHVRYLADASSRSAYERPNASHHALNVASVSIECTSDIVYSSFHAEATPSSSATIDFMLVKCENMLTLRFVGWRERMRSKC